MAAAFSAETKAAILAAHHAGLTREKIAEKIGISIEGLRHFLHRARKSGLIEPVPHRIPAKVKAAVLADIDATGDAYAVVAERHNLCRKQVYRIVDMRRFQRGEKTMPDASCSKLLKPDIVEEIHKAHRRESATSVALRLGVKRNTVLGTWHRMMKKRRKEAGHEPRPELPPIRADRVVGLHGVTLPRLRCLEDAHV